MVKKYGALGSVAWVLLIVGGLNWGLVGLGGFFGSDWNIVYKILGSWPNLEWIVYVLVGVSAVMALFGGQSKNGQMS